MIFRCLSSKQGITMGFVRFGLLVLMMLLALFNSILDKFAQLRVHHNDVSYIESEIGLGVKTCQIFAVAAPEGCESKDLLFSSGGNTCH